LKLLWELKSVKIKTLKTFSTFPFPDSHFHSVHKLADPLKKLLMKEVRVRIKFERCWIKMHKICHFRKEIKTLCRCYMWHHHLTRYTFIFMYLYECVRNSTREKLSLFYITFILLLWNCHNLSLFTYIVNGMFS
jgi:hypothetical protein